VSIWIDSRAVRVSKKGEVKSVWFVRDGIFRISRYFRQRDNAVRSIEKYRASIEKAAA
jgi:hypothetical protein